MNSVGFLLGVFLIPVIMLSVCHRFRKLKRRQRQIFWGLAIGYAVAVVLVQVALLAPPVRWVPERSLRTFLVYWGLLVLPVLGAVAGLLLTYATRKSPQET